MLPCEGMKWSLGLLSRQDVVAISDANAVVLMKEAGGILIGVTNISQVGFWTETYNPVYGFTRNPYEIYKSVGGSCGGEACIVAACGSPIGIGIDFGGCLRIPANRCGVFTHKSSPKLISIQGNPLFSNSTENNIAVIGPIVKYSEDLSFIISILTKLDVSRFLFDDDIQSRNIQYFYSSRSLCGYASPVRKEVENNIKKIVNELNRYSVNEAISLEIDETVDTIPIWGYKLAECNSDFKELMRNEKNEEIRPIREAINYFFGKREYCLYTIYNLLGLIAIKPTNDDQLKQVLDKIKDIFLDILGDHSVLLFPTEPLPLGYPYESLLRPHNNSYCALWSALEFPVTQVPVGLIKGCPMGVQIVAGPYNDHLCLAAARTLELLLGGYKEPSS
ncbi:fatty-acid amide hydrolase 2-like isoform X1 [Onthophagus taurus]|uniref:fatty-acid amide hydrolase 2-like isoform X1 n=1 Tax=Onthophagus taurus TaxID=166361 RepID=UPI0039BEC3ED